MSASLTDLPGVAGQILSLFATQLTTQGVALPERQHVGPGQIPAWDGEQLVVNLITVAQGQPGLAAAAGFQPTAINAHAMVGVSIVREVSVIQDGGEGFVNVPTSAQINTDGLASIGDAAALWQAATTIALNYLLVDPGESLVFELGTLGPEGGLAANRIVLTFSVS